MTRLSKQAIRKDLRTEMLGREIILLDTVDSTNKYAKRSMESHGSVVLAEKQRAGKGRMGRSWESPRGHSILMSILLRPERDFPSLHLMSLAAGLAVTEALGQAWPLSPVVKWPNDVWIAGKKVCGILVESQYRGEAMTKLIIGIGCNVNQQPAEFPDRLRWPATSLAIELGRTVDRNPLIAGILTSLEAWYDTIQAGSIDGLLTAWKAKCGHLNSPVRIGQDTGIRNGIFRDVTPEGAALIELDSSREETIFSGDLTPLTGSEQKK